MGKTTQQVNTAQAKKLATIRSKGRQMGMTELTGRYFAPFTPTPTHIDDLFYEISCRPTGLTPQEVDLVVAARNVAVRARETEDLELVYLVLKNIVQRFND